MRLLRESGAAEVHLRICSPPIVASCYYGVDTPTRDELIAHRLDLEETRDFVGADSLVYLPLSTLRADLGDQADTFCDACFSGSYPIPPEPTGPDTQLGLFPRAEGSEV